MKVPVRLMESISKALIAALAAGAAVSAQFPAAPPRPVCTALAGKGSCDWKAENGVGPGVRVVLLEDAAGHVDSRAYLRNALGRLSRQYGFTLIRITDNDSLTDADLQDAKVIIFSNGDGDFGGSVPADSVKRRVEEFVRIRGGGLLLIHAACAYVSTWPFLQQACVQQFRLSSSYDGTEAYLHVENRVVDGKGHGRANPYSAFFLAGLPDSLVMKDEWYTWVKAPVATAEVGGVPVDGLNMLLRLNEGSLNWTLPAFGMDHDLAWTHTQGNGITLFNSMGHTNIYPQSGSRPLYGDSLLWREIRYVAKDWDTVSSVAAIPSRARPRLVLAANAGSLSLSCEGAEAVSIRIRDITGRDVYSRSLSGGQSAEIRGLRRGVYFVGIASVFGRETRKVTLY